MTINFSGHESNERKLFMSVLLVSFTLAAKSIVALKTNSLALFSDSWHLLTDLASLIISWWGLKAATLPANYKNTFGYFRHGILTALINNVSLILVSLLILYKAVDRFMHPVKIEPFGMIIIAVLGLIVNCLILLNLKSNSQNINVKSAFLHFVGDALADIGVLLGGVVIYFTGWIGIDTLLSALLACLILKSAIKMTLECISIFLESTPKELDIEEMRRSMLTLENVLEVRDIHVWSLSKETLAMTAHVCIPKDKFSQSDEILHQLQHLLKDYYNIAHSTLQFEHAPCSSCFHSKEDHKKDCHLCINKCNLNF